MSMSDTPTDWTDWTDDRTTDHDPHNLVPSGFVDAWNSQTSETVTTIPEALAVAERAPSSTPHGELRRCPSCESVTVTSKTAIVERENQEPGAHKCAACGAHFDEPLASREAELDHSQVTLGEVCR